jgi:hypothetical protein
MSRFQNNLIFRDLNENTTLKLGLNLLIWCWKKKIIVVNSFKRYYASETKVIRSNESIEEFPSFEINTNYTCCGLYKIVVIIDFVPLKVHHLNVIFLQKITKVSITSIKTENVKYLTFRVFQRKSSYFKIIQNPILDTFFQVIK